MQALPLHKMHQAADQSLPARCTVCVTAPPMTPGKKPQKRISPGCSHTWSLCQLHRPPCCGEAKLSLPTPRASALQSSESTSVEVRPDPTNAQKQNASAALSLPAKGSATSSAGLRCIPCRHFVTALELPDAAAQGSAGA